MLLRPAVMRGRPGLLGTMARTAAVAGTATATANAVNRRQSRRYQQQAEQESAQQAAYDQQQQIDQMQAQLAQNNTQTTSGAGGDLMSQLKQLGDMKASGLLSDQEFAAAKAKLLGS
jgi:gas vesicle protein